jgi:hypothetical protein
MEAIVLLPTVPATLATRMFSGASSTVPALLAKGMFSMFFL